MKKKAQETKKKPLARAAKLALNLMRNKVIASLMLLGQGVIFLLAPSGDMAPTVRISAGLVLLVCVIVMALHLARREKKAFDYILPGLCLLPAAAAVFCLIRPEAIESHVRSAAGAVTVIVSLVNLAETLKIKEKRDWKFVVSVCGAAALAILGLVMVFAGELIIAFTQQTIGLFLILNALANIWYIVQLRREAREKEKEIKKEKK